MSNGYVLVGMEARNRTFAPAAVILISIFVGPGVTGHISPAVAAPAPGSLEERCIAGGTALPQEMRGFFFNHHPEKKREPRPTDHFLTVLETVAEFSGVVAQPPAECDGRFRQVLLAKAQFRASKTPSRWRSVQPQWEELGTTRLYLESDEYPPPLSPFGNFRGQQNMGTFGLGCTLDGRVKFKLEIVNEENQAIVAIRYAQLPLQVDSWFQARCLGKFSIQDSADARRCGKWVIGAKASQAATLWGVKVDRVGCTAATAIAQKALESPAFLQGSLLEQRVEGWQCFFGHRGANSCRQGSKHIYLIAGGSAAERCPGGPRVKRLFAANTSCDVAAALALALQESRRTEPLITQEASGSTWTCGVLRRLGEGDRMTSAYSCTANGAWTSIEITDPKADRVVPALSPTIPPDVLLPPAGAISFPLTPKLNFDYNTVKRRGKLLVSLEADSSLVGHRARIEIKRGTMECTWTSDEMEDTPFCGPTHWLQSTVTREITLKEKQLVAMGPNRRRGNWAYKAIATTGPFTYGGIRYTGAATGGWAGVINEASNCASNPWCHPNHRRPPAVPDSTGIS